MSDQDSTELIVNPTGELVASTPEYQLTKPSDITKFSKILAEFITKSELSTKIQGKKYVNVDGWKFAGLNFGLVPIVQDPIAQHQKGDVVTVLYHEVTFRDRSQIRKQETPYFASANVALVDKFRKEQTTRELTTDYYNYKCFCEIINTQTGVRVGSGSGLCSNLELAKSGFEEYAIQSMSQTRGIGRAFKNVIGFIIKSAGYEPTPLEERDGSNKVIVVEGESSMDVTALLKEAKTLDDVMILWESLPASSQANSSVKGAFTRKKNQLKAK